MSRGCQGDGSPDNLDTGPDGQKTWYIYGLGLIGQENQDGSYQSYHYDYRGSTTALTSINGAITDRFQYDPYGKITHREGTTDTPFLYNGRDGVMSDPNGLYHMRARYYNPEILRFTNQDILFGNIADPQSLNRYAYVNGQPINYVDPFGLCREDSDSIDDLQTILDIMGLVPGIGEPFDAINAIIYLLLGDYGYAALSIGACIPVLGIGATGGKIAGKIVKYSPVNPGPLGQYVAETFRSATYTETVLTKDTVFYRVYTEDGKVGSYMTRVPQNGAMQSQIDLALNPDWGNSAQNVAKVVVPKGTVIYEGAAAPQTINGGAGQLLGGGNQVYIPEVNAKWFK